MREREKRERKERERKERERRERERERERDKRERDIHNTSQIIPIRTTPNPVPSPFPLPFPDSGAQHRISSSPPIRAILSYPNRIHSFAVNCHHRIHYLAVNSPTNTTMISLLLPLPQPPFTQSSLFFSISFHFSLFLLSFFVSLYFSSPIIYI